MKSRIRVAFLFSFLLILLLFNMGKSDLLFDQTATDYFILTNSMCDTTSNLICRIADNFEVPYEANIDSLVWWGGYWPDTTGPLSKFWIEIYPESTGYNQPMQAPIYSERVNFTETNLPSRPNFYRYEAIIPQFHALQGERYWIQFMGIMVEAGNYWGINSSWPANIPGWGDGQEFYLKCEYFGFPLWTASSSIFGDAYESGFQIYGTATGIKVNDESLPTLPSRICISPNPFTTVTRLEVRGASRNHKAKLLIYDSAGRLVKSGKLETSTYELGTDLKAGIYFLKLNGTPVGKVVKVR
jgi:hypothetical protein